MTITRAAICAAAILSSSAMAHAEDAAGSPAGETRELRAHLLGAIVVTSDPSFDWVSETTVAPNLHAGVGVFLVRGLEVGAEVHVGGATRTVMDGATNTLASIGGALRLTYAVDVVPIVRPYVTAAAGVYRAINILELNSTTLESTSTAFGGDVAGGLEARFGGRIGGGVMTDFGYAFRTPYKFEDARSDDGSRPGSVDLGQIRVDGFQWRLGGFVGCRF